MERLSRKKLIYAAQESSFQRILKIQQCLLEGRFKADCVLIIVGVDSKFCNGSRNFLEKILPGFEEATSSHFASGEFAEEAMDDLVICIKKKQTEIYCNPLNYDCVMSYAACWSNLVVHCLDKFQYENHEDLTEDLKILSFVKMVEDCSVVAVPYYYGVTKEDEAAAFEPMLLEQWPLIQAYALEDIGGGGFFTMKHEVVDGTDLLNEAMSSFDPLGLELLLIKQLSQFEKQWKTLIGTMDVSGSQHLASLQESAIAEPLTTYYLHATGDHNAAAGSQPSVRFGISTGKKMQGGNKGKVLGESGIGGSHAYHMICQGRDSKGVLSCKRTYFFEPRDSTTIGSTVEGKVPDPDVALEMRLLEQWYMLAVDGVDLAISEYTKDFDIIKCKELAVQSIIDSATEKKYAFIPVAADIDVVFNSRDQLGRINAENGTSKMMEITIHNVPSMKFKGSTLGSVAFSETFFTSSITLEDEPGSKNTECIVLTRGVPRYASWLRDHSTTGIAQEQHLEKSFGNRLIDGSSCVLLSGGWPIFDAKEVTVEGFENALSIRHAQFGDITIPLQSVKSWETFDNDSAASATLIIIHPKPGLLDTLPFWLAKDGRIVLAFHPKSKAHVAFYDQAFHVWKEVKKNFEPLKTINALPEDIANIYDIIQESHKVADEKEVALTRLFRVFPNLKRFFKHFELSSATYSSLNRKDFGFIMTEEMNDKDNQEQSLDDSELLVTILTGLPGSDSDTLCRVLTSLARESGRWLTARVPSDIKETFSVKAFQEQLSLTYKNFNRQKGRPQPASRKRRRLILLTQGFVNIKDLVLAIEEHPDAVIRSKLKIGSVTCCINPSNLFLFGRTLMPLALEQCKSGYVNNAVFTGCVEADKACTLSCVQRLIRQCNRDISFIIAKSGEVTRTPDVETILSDTAFSDIKAVRARAVFNERRSETQSPVIQQITVPFYQPLDRSRFLTSLKDLKGQLSIEKLFDDVVLYMEGRVGFIDHSDAQEFKWCKTSGLHSLTTVSQALSPRPPSSKIHADKQDLNASKYYVTFLGLRLQEEKMRQFMQNWRKQEKPLLSRKDIPAKKLKEIENNHKLDPLPSGWFFNGSQYVSFEGDKIFKHPSFNTFVDDYVASMNEDLQKYNEAINQLDMFSNED